MEPQQPTHEIVTVYEAMENMNKLEGRGIYETGCVFEHKNLRNITEVFTWWAVEDSNL